MANNNGGMTYPILFDLEAGVKKAAEDWDNKYADKLEKAIQKRALEIRLTFDPTKLDTLDQVKRRLAQLKIEPITAENKTAIKDLVRELNALAKVMEKVQKYSNIQTPELQQALANKANAEAAHMAEKYRQANERVEIAKRRVTLAEQKHAEAIFQTAKAGKRQSEVYQEQTTYLNRLLKRMAVYWSVSTVQSFLTNVREVTAQFELQRVSLGAIIQDQNRANALFAEIKSFALKSPVKILDLTKYTKQVAAYGFETEKLFDTTKRLADISVGLGADMSRATLFLGQVYASNYLRAAELRQATELGIPLVDKLAKKLEELNGRAYSAAEVMNLISKRAISYELVEQIFKDMTSAGGEFYNMQERQGNTLYGMWSKLGDAAAMMYDEIGNTSFINSGMKDAIGLLAELMKNWRYFGNAILMVVPTMLLVHNIEKARAANSARQIAAMNTLTAATTRRIAAEKALNNAITSGLANTAAKARMNLILAQTEEKVAQKALTAGNSIGLLGKRLNLFGGALQKLSAFVATNFWTILLTGVALLTSALVSANEKANRLKKTLAEIGAAGDLEIYQSKENFEKLANAAVKAATGSKKQRDALDELHRTYRDMIPAQDMTLEKLIAMEGKYGKLTIAVEEYIRARLKQQQIEAVTSEIGADLAKAEKKMTEDAKGFYYTYDKGATKLKLNYDQIQLLIKGIREIAKAERSLPTRKVFAKALTDYVGLDLKGLEVGLDEWLNTFDDGLFAIVRHTREFEAELDRIEANEKLDTTLGKYAEGWKKVNERIDSLTVKGAKVGTFTYDQATINASIKQYKGYLKEVLGNAWDESFALIEEHVGKNGDKLSALFIEKMMAPEYWDKLTVAQQQAILKVKKAYEGLIPTDRTVNILREKLQDISTLYGMSMDVAKQFRMNAGETIEDYAKRVKSSLEDAQNSLKELQFNKSQMDAGVGVGVLNPVSDEELKDADTLVKVLSALFELISGFTKSKSSGRKSDPRLQTLQEIANKMAEVNKEYDELLKKEGQTKALADTQKLFASSFKQMKDVAKKYGFKLPVFEVPQTVEDVQKWYKAIMDNIKRLNLKNADKVLIELGFKSDKLAINKQQKDIEAQIKRLADRISRTKTAKEFYEKILGMTGDLNLAGKVSMSIYGDNGDLKALLAKQVKELTNGIELPEGIIKADNLIDYKALREFAEANRNELGKTYDELVKIADQGQKDLAKTYEGYLKDLEKAKKYSDKRIELARYTANAIAEIEASTLPDVEKKRLTAGYRERETQKQGELEWEAFKDMPMYVQMFDDLDNASVRTLSNMKQRLSELQSVWGSTLNPTQLKELQSRMSEIDAQLARKNPFKTLGDAMKRYQTMSKSGSQKDAEQKLVNATDQRIAAQNKLNMALEVEATAQERYNKAVAEYGKGSDQAKSAKLFWDAARQGVDDAKKLAKQTGLSEKEAQRLIDAWKSVKDAIGLSLGEVFKIVGALGDLASGIGKVTSVFGGSAEDVQYWDDIANGLNEVTSGIENMVQAALSGNPISVATSAVTAIPNMISGFANLFSAKKVKRANKEIKRQQQLLDQLEYTYSRLEKGAEKAFGADYISNFKQQQKILQAQARAYQAQAEAERSKGKKADEGKIAEYEAAYRDTMDKIADMQGQVAAQLLGTDLTSAARDFAKAWLDAYKEFSSTSDAMSEKFREMIENMVVESALAKVMERALKPMFDMIDNMSEQDFYSQSFWRQVVEKAEQGTKDADAGAQTMMKFLERAGISLRDTGGQLTGISRDIATASEESINGLAAHMNTVEYYVAQIHQNVAAIAVQGGESPTLSGVDYSALIQQSVDRLAMIERYSSEILVECRRNAIAAESALAEIRRVIVPRGNKGSHYVYVGM